MFEGEISVSPAMMQAIACVGGFVDQAEEQLWAVEDEGV